MSVIGHPHYVRGQRFNPIAMKMFESVRGSGALVHCHQQHVLASTLLALAGRLRGTPVFVTDLGGGGWDLSAYWSTDSLYRAHLHISEYSRRHHGHDQRANAHVIYGGVDLDRFSPARQAKEDFALFVGRLLPHKGIDVLLQALPDGTRLKIVGGEADERYLSDLRELARSRDVEFMGVVDDDRLIREYRAANCLVLPSVHRDLYGSTTGVPELLGQTLLEAMACGTAVICTDVASMPEIVVDGECGFRVPPNDVEALRAAMIRLRDQPMLAARMGVRGRERVAAHFSWETVVESCLDLYQRYSGLSVE